MKKDTNVKVRCEVKITTELKAMSIAKHLIGILEHSERVRVLRFLKSHFTGAYEEANK